MENMKTLAACHQGVRGQGWEVRSEVAGVKTSAALRSEVLGGRGEARAVLGAPNNM